MLMVLGIIDQLLLQGRKNNKMGDERIFQQFDLSTISFHIPCCYKEAEYIGGGAYGNVIKAVDEQSGETVAIKKMYEPFRDGEMAKRVLREIRLLKRLHHENVIELVDIFTPDQNPSTINSLYTVTMYAGWSLNDILNRQRRNGKQLLSDGHIKLIIYQILRGLKYIHSANVIHRDLKPSNIAVNSDVDVTILDFGFARTTGEVMTEYVMTRWYRAPEVMYWNVGVYGEKADMWSLGCIMSELLLGKPLFPGEDVLMQFRLITALCGSPDVELLNKIEIQSTSNTRQQIESYNYNERVQFAQYFQLASADAIDLLDRILLLDPDRRLSVDEALGHSYLSEYRMPDDEPIADAPFEIEETQITINDIQQWKRCVWEEIENFHHRNPEEA